MTLEELYRAERENNWKNYRIRIEAVLAKLLLTFFDDVWATGKKAYDLETERLIEGAQ